MVVRTLVAKKSRPAEVPFLWTFLLLPLQMYTAPCAWRKNFAVLLKRKDGLSWRHWPREAIPLDSDIDAGHAPKKLFWCLKGYRHSINPPQTSPTVQQACCTQYSMPSPHTVWCGHQCSVLCFACYAVARPCIICILLTSNANTTVR